MPRPYPNHMKNYFSKKKIYIYIYIAIDYQWSISIIKIPREKKRYISNDNSITKECKKVIKKIKKFLPFWQKSPDSAEPENLRVI